MNIYVKFCGGCNPHYDRAALYRRLQKAFPQIEFHTDETQAASSDLILVIEGCNRSCVALSGELGERDCFRLFSVNDYDAAYHFIENHLKIQKGIC